MAMVWSTPELPCLFESLAISICFTHETDDGGLYALNTTDGAVVWKVQTGGKVFAGPTVSDDGSRVYAMT